MKELDYYFSALFRQTNRLDYMRYALLVAIISFLSYSIYARGYLLYVAAMAALLLQVVSWSLKTRVENIRYLANEFQKISMLYRAYGSIPSEFQLSHLKALVSEKISSEVEKKKEKGEIGAEYNLAHDDNPREILTSMIHENSYWNHHLYKSVFFLIVSGVTIILIVLITAFLFALPLIKTDPEYTIPRLAFTFLSFSLLYEVLEKAASSYSSSKIMLEIDNELSRINEEITEQHLLKLFNQYCEIKETAPDVPYFIYKSNKGKLNNGWNSRIQMNTMRNA